VHQFTTLADIPEYSFRNGSSPQEQVMAHSIDDLLVRQVGTLVSETAYAACINMEQIPSMEAHFYHVLALYCAEKQRLADAAFASGVGFETGAAARTQKGLVYW
jgi:hypothetical protein